MTRDVLSFSRRNLSYENDGFQPFGATLGAAETLGFQKGSLHLVTAVSAQWHLFNE